MMQCICCDRQMQQVETPPERIDNILVRTGHWECDCGYARPIYGKFPLIENRDELIKSVKCHCCLDSGQIVPGLVRKYILEEYQNHDPPVLCTRCDISNRWKEVGWDIATRLQCEKIHSIEIKKVNFTEIDREQKQQLQSKIAALSQSKLQPKFADIDW